MPLWQAAAAHAGGACRLHPRHAGLRALARTAAELTGDWDALSERLAAEPDAAALAHRARLGWPEPARAPCPTAPPEAAAAAARLACELHLLAGDPAGALAALDAAGTPPAAGSAAWLAEWRAEALLMQRDAAGAAAVLAPHLARHPARMGLWLQQARAAFFRGDFAAAEAALQRFRALKQAQLGAPPAPDLRDRITADAAAGGALPPARGPAPQGSPGLAAAWLAQPGAVPPFTPVAGAIPPRLGHYWEGPLSGPAARGAARWRALHPGLVQTLHDRAAAEAWLAAHDPEALPAFAAQTGAAARADLFRLCWLAQGGGVWADLDEYPRAAVDGWLVGAAAVVVLEAGYGTVANNFLAARPGHPLIAAARAGALARLGLGPTADPWWDSGPAQLTQALVSHLATPGLRVLTQADYCARVSTNLPFPHKRRADHWRPGPAAVARR
jgi:hypothetical protein